MTTNANIPAFKMDSKSRATVTKSNVLARAKWLPPSIWALRLIALVASKIQTSDQEFKTYSIHLSELFGPDYSGSECKILKDAIDKCMSHPIMLQHRYGDWWREYAIFSYCGFTPQTGFLEIRFDPALKEHYLNLKNCFVRYNLCEFLKLSSVYSQRIYEILKSWSNNGEVTILMADLHDMLETPPSMQRDFSQFRLRALERAKKDIEAHTNFDFSWQAIKKGRSVHAIRFVFSKKEIMAISKSAKEKSETRVSQKRNKDFIDYIKCSQEKGPNCQGGHQKENICALCKEFRNSIPAGE